MSESVGFNPGELCSSKLWEIVRSETRRDGSRAELEAAVEELCVRRHYLAEIEQLDELLLRQR